MPDAKSRTAAPPDDDVDLPGLHEGDPIIGEFETPDKSGQRPWQAYKIDGEIVHVREPKGAFFLDLSTRLKTEEEQIEAITETLDKVFDEASRELLWERLRDDEDDFDADELGVVIRRLQEHWGKDRGGSSSGSRSSSRPRTKRSTARRR